MVAETEFAILDVPRDHPPADADSYLRAAIAWHFGEDTGSPFWLRAAKNLDFDPLTAIGTFADLRLFPNLVDQLRDVRVQDLIPPRLRLPFPSPARLRVRWHHRRSQTYRPPSRLGRTGNPLAGRGFQCGRLHSRPRPTLPDAQWAPRRRPLRPRHRRPPRLALFYPIDLDPRWVKQLSARGATDEMSAYVDHVLDQARFILTSQPVGNLHTTPPLIEAIARDDALVDLVNAKIRYVLLSGAHVDLDTLDLLRDIFDATITTVYGSTMILSQAATRTTDDRSFIFDPRSPYVVFWVIDPDTGLQVPYGERGQVIMNHISKGMLIPNNLERDTAIRVSGPDGQVGDSLTEVVPVATFDGQALIEGVY